MRMPSLICSIMRECVLRRIVARVVVVVSKRSAVAVGFESQGFVFLSRAV